MTKYCIHCGQELPEGAKFCPNCGRPVADQDTPTTAGADESDRERERREDFQNAWEGASFTPPPPPEPTPTAPAAKPSSGDDIDSFPTAKPQWEIERERLRQEASDDWAMFDLGPAKPRRRRTWLWVLIGALVLFVLACCIFFAWVSFTDSGMEWLENAATQAAIEMQNATEQAATPQP